MLLARGVLSRNHVPVWIDIEQDLIVTEPGTSLQCDGLQVHLLTLPLIFSKQMHLTAVYEDQTIDFLPWLYDLLTFLIHSTSQIHHDLLNELRWSIPIIEVVIEEECKPLDDVTEDFVHQLPL